MAPWTCGSKGNEKIALDDQFLDIKKSKCNLEEETQVKSYALGFVVLHRLVAVAGVR